MSNEEIEQKVREFAQDIIESGEYDYADIVLECGIIDFYKGINCYTMNIVDGNTIALVFDDRAIKFNRTISSRQLEMLKNDPKRFMELDYRYFMDNQNIGLYSEDKARKLIDAAKIGINKMPQSEQTDELSEKIDNRASSIKKQTELYKNI